MTVAVPATLARRLLDLLSGLPHPAAAWHEMRAELAGAQEAWAPQSLALFLPTFLHEGVPMDFEIKSNETLVIGIGARTREDNPALLPANDVVKAVADSPAALGVAVKVDAGKTLLTLSPLVKAAAGVKVTISDSAGLKPVELVVSIVQDTTAVSLALDDPATAVRAAQPEPAAA